MNTKDTPTPQLERILAAYRLTLGAWSHADTAESREDSDEAAWHASEAVKLARRGDLFSALEYARVALDAEEQQGVPVFIFPCMMRSAPQWGSRMPTIGATSAPCPAAGGTPEPRPNPDWSPPWKPLQASLRSYMPPRMRP